MEIERGDSIKFGEKWCKKYKRKDLINKVIKLTPQWFEIDSGLYCYEKECPGIRNKKEQESDSIYHLFGNKLEDFMDCQLIKGTEADRLGYQKIIQDKINDDMKYWEQMAEEVGGVE